MTVRETVDAGKTRFEKSDLDELFDGATKLVVAKGKKVLELKPGEDSAEDIAKAALGPSGRLRAPAIRAGKTWFIGFNEEAYAQRFG